MPKRLVVGVNDLATTHPELAAELVDRHLATQVMAGSARKVLWRCGRGHVWEASLNNRSTNGRGCPYCSGRKVLVGFNDLATTHPEVAACLVDASLSTSLSAGMTRRVGWRCESGHEWVASVASVVSGSGCPYCGHRKVLAGFNDLATTHPDVAAELVDTRLATRVMAGSARKVAWRCASGHEFVSSVSDRALRGLGCPYCSGKKVLVGFNDLATVRPDLASMLDDESVGRLVTVGSSRKVAWRCGRGHRWEAAPHTVASGHGCPYCAGQRPVVGETDLATTYPKLAAELVDKSLSTSLSRGSSRKVGWRCEHGHMWFARVAARVGGQGCPYCSGRKAVVGETDISTTHPEVAAELVDASCASRLSAGSGQRVLWQCGLGHRWVARVAERCGFHATGCPVCAGLGPSAGQSEVADFVRELVGDDAVVVGDRSIISPKELDVVVPSARLAIEFNGVWWHCEHNVAASSHAQKLELARSAGYSLVFVWDDVWDMRKDVVKRLLASRLGLASRVGDVLGDERLSRRYFARNLRLGEVSGRVAGEFMEANHIQGRVSATRHFALFSDDVPVAVMSVRAGSTSGRAPREPGDWDIQRYATCGQVVGGFSRLMRHAERTLAAEGRPVRRWLSFSANDVSDGNLYARCGFLRDAELGPSYRYAGASTGWVRRPKEAYQLRRFRDDPDLAFDESWTESEAARRNGLYRCWDSGSVRWVYEVSA